MAYAVKKNQQKAFNDYRTKPTITKKHQQKISKRRNFTLNQNALLHWPYATAQKDSNALLFGRHFFVTAHGLSADYCCKGK